MSIKQKLRNLINDSIRMCENCKESTQLLDELSGFARRIDEPLRVAVVGIMKAGKSTFMNALIKEKLLFTGNEETTYTVSWFKYASNPSLKIIFKDNQQPVNAPFSDLEKWTVRARAKDNPRLKDVKYIEIYYPNDVLKIMELIDTPGLNSSYKLDSKNTLEFLGVSSKEEAKELEDVTIHHASDADAIIYAYTRSAGDTDRELLEQFHGNSLTSSTSPVNALGVCTRADNFWEPGSKPPLEIAKRVTDKTMKDPDMKRLLYVTLPVVAKMVEGITSLNKNDWEYIHNLTNIDQDTLGDTLSFLPDFTSKPVDAFRDQTVKKYIGEPDIRDRIIKLLDGYGLYEIVNCLRDTSLPREELIELIYEKSGIKAVNNLVCNHFGNRSFLIKSQYIMIHLRTNCYILRKSTESNALKRICDHILENIHDIENNEHEFKELKILQSYYNSQLTFNNEEEYKEFLQVTGEEGKTCEAKLGLDAEVRSVTELAAIAREKVKQWRIRANDYGLSRHYEQAATDIARSFEIMLHHLDELSGNE